jgi:hypothetical protein
MNDVSVSKAHPDVQPVADRLRRSHANLRARGMITAAEDMNAALTLVDVAVKERDEARIKAREVDQLRGRIDRLDYDLTMMRLARDEARNEARIAAIPKEEAQAMARAEVRDILRPFLTEGGQSMRMLAVTIKAALDAAWGKEVQ